MTTSVLVDDPAGVASPGRDGSDVGTAPDRGLRRFVVSSVVCLAAVTVPYLWILWDLWTGTVGVLRQLSPDNFYDLQGRALLSGHLWVPNGSLGIEAFVHDGRQYTYFGLFPSILRLPVLALTHTYDGRLTAPSMLLAWVVTLVAAPLLLWRVRVVIRGDAAIGWTEAVADGVALAAVCGGSVLMYLAASPKVSDEDLAWSVALTLACLFLLLGVLERPSWGRITASGVLVLCAALDRAPTGYACCLAALLVAGWFALPGNRRTTGRWIVPTALAGVIPLGAVLFVNWAKLGTPFGLSEADQVWTHINAHRRVYLAASGGSGFGLKFLPSTLLAYLDPAGVHVQSAFPWITLPTSPARAVGGAILDDSYPTASIPASMPLYFLLGVWGLVTAFRPRPVGRVAVTRVLMVAMVAATSGVLLFGYIADRYLADILPLVALAGFVGLVDVWRRLEGRGGGLRVAVLAAVVVLGGFGVWANVGAAATPSALWTNAQSAAFVRAQLRLGPAATGSPVHTGDRLPYFAPAGTIYAVDDCAALYVSTGYSYAVVPQQQLMHETWDPVEQGPGISHTLEVVFRHPVEPGDPAVTLVSWGRTLVQLVPSGVDSVRTVVSDPGGPAGAWPPLSTGPQPVEAGVPYQITVITDPYLQSITAGGLGGGIVHFLAGSGPAVLHTTPEGAPDTSAVSVTDATGAPPSMALCHQVVRAAGR